MITFTLRQNHRAEDMSPHPLLLALEAASLMDSDSIRWALWRNTPNWCMIQWVSSGIDSNTSPWWLPKDCFFLMLLIDVNWIKSIKIFFFTETVWFLGSHCPVADRQLRALKTFWRWMKMACLLATNAFRCNFRWTLCTLVPLQVFVFFSSCDSYIMSTKS